MPKHGDKKIDICDVHYIVNKDSGIREVYYCSDCNAWMCKMCEVDIPKRALAMVKSPFVKRPTNNITV